MHAIRQLEMRRDQILAEMKAIRSMKRGTINQQLLSVLHKGAKQSVQRGPYHVFSRYDHDRGKTVSYRLTTPEQIERARRDVAAHKRFVALCREFERLTERLGELESSPTEVRAEKKRRSSPSNATGR